MDLFQLKLVEMTGIDRILVGHDGHGAGDNSFIDEVYLSQLIQ
jgi:hypothetical protein